MKFLLEVLLAIFLHPIAFILAIINISGRRDLNVVQKLAWGIISVVWGIGPILYVLLGNGQLW